METISHIRELEASIVQDAKNVNSILAIKKHLKSENRNVQNACIHSLRRVFVHLCDSGQLSLPKQQGDDTKHSVSIEKFQQIKLWTIQQIQSYLSVLFDIVTNGDNSMKPLAIRTILEFVKREQFTKVAGHSSFGVETFVRFFDSLLSCSEIDIDILVMLKDEVFSYPDCAYFGYIVLNKIMTAKKAETKRKLNADSEPISSSFLQNCIDLLRVIPFPQVNFSDPEIRSTFLVAGDESVADEDSDDDGSDNDSDDNAEDVIISESVKRKRAKKRGSGGAEKKRKRQRLSRYNQLVDLDSYKRVFSKAWLTLMSIPGLKLSQHKVILKHLPEHTMQYLFKPILLADYLSSSFSIGGIVAVLALDSLFQLITMHNLDYPKYFTALYKLCNITVFSASYRARFMRLLSKSLTSVNLPHYTVAAFCKRLATLALQVPTPVASYCIAQITKLIRDHPQLVQLLHRAPVAITSVAAATGTSAVAGPKEFDTSEETDLEKTGAAGSSLWELIALKNHYFHSINALATTLENPESTENSSKSDLLIMEDFITPSFASLIEAETSKGKKNFALDYQKPVTFLNKTIIDECFGGNF